MSDVNNGNVNGDPAEKDAEVGREWIERIDNP